jgi:hypothetical protein
VLLPIAVIGFCVTLGFAAAAVNGSYTREVSSAPALACPGAAHVRLSARHYYVYGDTTHGGRLEPGDVRVTDTASRRVGVHAIGASSGDTAFYGSTAYDSQVQFTPSHSGVYDLTCRSTRRFKTRIAPPVSDVFWENVPGFALAFGFIPIGLGAVVWLIVVLIVRSARRRRSRTPPTWQTPPGWYPDPYPVRLRYWDGARWTETTTDPAPAPTAPHQP